MIIYWGNNKFGGGVVDMIFKEKNYYHWLFTYTMQYKRFLIGKEQII
jgi:hypothetical protein